MLNLGEGLKKVFLVGVGAIATTAEKSKEVIDELVKKGELTVEQGKVLNEELKRNMKEKVRNTFAESEDSSNIVDKMDKMSDEEIQSIKAKLAEMEKNKKTDGE